MGNRSMYRADVLLDPVYVLKGRKLGLRGCTAKVTSGERVDSVGGPV